MDPNTFIYTCPYCGRSYNIKTPQKSGVYNIPCKMCGQKSKYRVTGLDVLGGLPSAPAPQQPAQPQQPQEKNPITSYVCPACNQEVKIFAPETSGNYPVTCAFCKTPSTVFIAGKDVLCQPSAAAAPRQPDAPVPPVTPAPPVPPVPHTPAATIPPVPPEPQAPCTPPPAPAGAVATAVVNEPVPSAPRKGAAALVLLGKMFNDTYPLSSGRTTVGRFDESKQSDIAIKGDSYMSRRSIAVEAVYDAVQGFTYRLTVLSATNPVLLNGQPMGNGDSAFLNFGDIITLGNSRLRLDPAK